MGHLVNKRLNTTSENLFVNFTKLTQLWNNLREVNKQATFKDFCVSAQYFCDDTLINLDWS